MTEVMDACHMLEDLQQESIMAKKFPSPLMDILQKHQARVLSHQSTTLSSTSPLARQPFGSIDAMPRTTNIYRTLCPVAWIYTMMTTTRSHQPSSVSSNGKWCRHIMARL
jgi:hypothetical protein